MRKAVKVGAVALVVSLGLLLAVKWNADRRYFDGYDATIPLRETVSEVEEREGYQRVKLYFESIPGEQIPTLLTLPKAFEGKVPCVIFLHGIGQKKEFLDEITTPFNEHGFAMATFDQYTRGERKVEEGPVAGVVAFRQRAGKTINESRRLMDYLSTRPDIDPQRLYLVGASYGAITGSTVAAFDKRVKATVLVYGGGDFDKLLSAPMIREELGVWLTLVKPLTAFMMQPADPIHYVHRIAPRPVLFQNGRRDRLVAPEASEALFAAAREPKAIKWYESDHLGSVKEEEHVIREVLDDALLWLLEQDKPYRSSEDKATETPAQQASAASRNGLFVAAAAKN